MTQIANVCECPRCKEIALRLTDEEISDDNTMAYTTYECDRCGYLEVHSEGLPSWYSEGGQPQDRRTEETDDE